MNLTFVAIESCIRGRCNRWSMSADRTHRLRRQAELQVPRRRPRRRVATGRPQPLPPTAQNHV